MHCRATRVSGDLNLTDTKSNKMMQTVLHASIEPGAGFKSLAHCISAVETYNNQANKLIASSLLAGEAIHNIFVEKRWEEMGLTGFKAMCQKLGWTRSSCYELRRGWEMYLEFQACVPSEIKVAGAYAWAQLHRVHKNRRRIVLSDAIAFASEDNGEVTGPLILAMDKPEIKETELEILGSIPDLTMRQKAEDLAIELAKKRGRILVESSDCHEAIEELNKSGNGDAFPSCSNDPKLPSGGLSDRKTRSYKPTGKNYDELLETTQKIFAVNEELKGELQQMRSEMQKLTDSYEEKIALMQQELERLKGENQRLKASV